MNNKIKQVRMAKKYIALGLFFCMHICLFFQSTKAASQVIRSRPYARSAQGKYIEIVNIALEKASMNYNILENIGHSF